VKYRSSQQCRGYQGRRSMVRGWLVARGMQPGDADAWCDAWEVTVEARGIHPEDAAYWTGATTWIAQQRKTRKLPT
jgi:hypothetical protein